MGHVVLTALARTLAKASPFARAKSAQGAEDLTPCPRLRHLADSNRHIEIAVPNGGMEPTLPAGGAVMVDPARTAWEPPAIVAVETGVGAIVARAGTDAVGRRILVHDNPAWPDLPVPVGARIIGRVCCLARAED